MENITVINSKLIPPMPQATYMRRSSFIKKMNQAMERQLLLVHSGPGFGKSLGLAQYFSDQPIVYSWYTVTEEDDDIIPFVTYLHASIERVIPNFKKAFHHLDIPQGFVSDEEIHQWAAFLINELCEISEPFVIIIDDFHLVDHVFQINVFMERMIKLLPPHIRLVISGRSRPKWSSLLKLRLNDRLFEITKEDLVFSEEEIFVYLEDYFQMKLDEEKIKEIVTYTEGWAIAINLLALQWSENELSENHIIKPVFKNIFDYLSEEVFQSRTPKEQEWLLAFAIFPIISVKLVEEFYGEEAVTQLKNIANEHAFIQSLGDNETFRYHALFHQFLTNKWRQTDREKYAELNKKATYYYLEKNNYFQAAYHATLTEDNRYLSEILSKTSETIIRSGQFDWFLEVYQKLDRDITDEFYALYYYEGEVHRYRAYYEQARRAYIRCLQHAEKNDDAYYISLSNAGIAHIYLDTIQPALAESYLKKAIHWSQRTDSMPEKESIMMKRQFAENLVNLGRAKDAIDWVKSEQIDNEILREGNLDARILLRMGKLFEAKNILLEHTEKKVAVPDSHREDKVLLSLIHIMNGEVKEALSTAEQGVQIGKEMNARFVEAVGYTRRGHAELIAFPYDIEKAKSSFKRAIELMEQVNVSRGKAEPFMGLVGVKARQGLYDEAVHYGLYALRETEKVNDNWLSSLIHISIGIVYFYKQDRENCEKHIQSAMKLLHTCGDVYHEMISLFWLMNVYAAKNETKKLADIARKFAKICIEEEYQFYLMKDTLLGPFDRHLIYPLFQTIAQLEIEDENVNTLMNLLKIDEYDGHPGYQLYVKMFGHLTIKVGHKYGEELNWQREKAKELFLYFLFHQDRFIPKEEMMQVLWGDLDENTADRNFKVTLNALLRVLEPNREARKPSFFIIRKQKLYRLNPKATIISERDLFLDAAERGLQSEENEEVIDALLTAEKLYVEKPFEDMRDVDWLAREKQHLENKYIAVLQKLAQTYMKIGNYANVITYAEKILQQDATWEEAYRLLMLAYYRLQNRPQSIKWYERCAEVLTEELGIEPMQATVDLYNMIMHNDEWD